MTGLETFIRKWLQQSIRDPWPAGNVEFVTLLDGLIRHQGHKDFQRTRGQGTTTLVHAAATYAAGEGLCPYVVIVAPDLMFARCWRESLVWVVEEGGYRGQWRDGRFVFGNGCCIGVHPILGRSRGLNWRYQGRIVRPSLVLADLGVRPVSPIKCQLIDKAVGHWVKAGGLAPAGVAVCTTVE